MSLNYSIIKLQQIKLLIGELTDYNDVVEEFFTKASKDIEKQFKKLENKYKDDEEALINLSDHFSDKYHETARVFPNHFRITVFNQIMSVIVYELFEICELHNRIMKTEENITDYKNGSDLEKVKKYLRQIAKIDFDKLNPFWIKINVAYNIRNVFIHKLGKIETDDKKFVSIKEHIKKTRHLDYKYYVEREEDAKQVTLFINKEFVPDILVTAKELFTTLLKDLLTIQR